MITAGEPQRGLELGLTAEEIAFIVAFLARWQPVYALYIDENAGRTKLVVEQTHLLIADFMEYDQDQMILNRIASSKKASIEELEICNIHNTLLKKKRSAKVTSSIDTKVIPVITSIGDGVLKVKCGNSENTSIKVIETATNIEYCYQIGGETPATVNPSVMTMGVSSKAHFEFTIAPEYSGEKIYIYFRWVNYHYPEYNGPWGKVQVALVL